MSDSGTIRTHTDYTLLEHTQIILYLKGEQGGKPGFERGLSVMKYWTSLLKKYSTLPPNFLISFSNHEAWGYHNELPKEGGGAGQIIQKCALLLCSVHYLVRVAKIKVKDFLLQSFVSRVLPGGGVLLYRLLLYRLLLRLYGIGTCML